MKTFKQFLTEEQNGLWGDSEQHPDLFSVEHNPESGITTHTYINPELKVSRKIFVKGDTAYTGWGNTDITGGIESSDVPQTDISKDLKIAKSDTAFEHLADFARRNPHIKTITYQTADTEAGNRSHKRVSEYWPSYQKKYGIDTQLQRVDTNPLRDATSNVTPTNYDVYYDTPISDVHREAWNKFSNNPEAFVPGLSPHQLSNRDYDIQGWFNKNFDPKTQKFKEGAVGEHSSGTLHFTDEFKKPNHPTFSTGSKYHGTVNPTTRERNVGGEWKQAEDGNWAFHVPNEWSKQRAENLINYWNEYEKGHELIVPSR